MNYDNASLTFFNDELRTKLGLRTYLSEFKK
jgi:hypothetical protein